MKKSLILYLSLAVLLFSSVGKIAVTKGEVSVVRDGETLSASSGFELLEKDTVVTGEGARAQLVFNDETVVSVGKGSEFLVEEYLFEAAADADVQKASFRSLKGAFKTITGKIGKVAPEKFKLATKTATIGIRGTHFLGKINIDGDKIACTHGAISVQAFAGGDAVTVPAGQITSVLAGALPTPPRKFTAVELNELNEASGVAPSEEEAAPEAAAEGEEAAIVMEEEAVEEEAAPAAETLMAQVEQKTVVEEVKKQVDNEKKEATEDEAEDKIEEETGFDIAEGTLTKLPDVEYIEELIPDTVEIVITEGGYALTHIQNSGPVDLYGKQMTASIGTPDCEEGDCELSSDSSWARYVFASNVRFLRNGTYVAANQDGTGENLGQETRYEVYPLLGFQQFSVVTDSSEDAQGYLGQMGTITGVSMMDTAAGNYEGYNVEYSLGSEDSEHEYISYDNLGEFAIVTSSTVDPTASGEVFNNMLYMGAKSSWDTFLAGDVPDHLIYKMLVINSVGYDATDLDFYSSYYNGLETGTDFSNSRVIGNTHNQNILYVKKAEDNGEGWSIVLGKAGGTESILFDGALSLWAGGEKNEYGYYYLDTDVEIDGVDNTVIEGELYGSQLQGFGMSLTSESTTTVFADNPSENPASFDATLVAGYRTDDAGEINLDTELTDTATMSGFTTSKVFVEGSGSLYMGQIGMTLNRDTGDIDGTIKLGEDTANPDYSITIDGTGGTTSAFISDDYFASILTGATKYTYDTEGTLSAETALTPDFASGTAGGFMATHSGFALDDVTWGYSVASYDNALYQFHHKSAWVAGIDTEANVLAGLNAEIYTYDGKILGRVYGNGPSGTINSDASWVHVVVDFGSNTPLSGSMAFSVIEYPELVWYADIKSEGSSFDASTGAMLALMSANANSIVTIEADPFGDSTDAGGLNADLYGAEGTAIGGNFYLDGTIDNRNYLTALGVFKGATDQTLTAPTVGEQEILVGRHFSTWIDSPTGTDNSWREATQTSGSSGTLENSAVYISLDGDTGTYRDFGKISYTMTHDGTGFAMDEIEYGGSGSGTITIGTSTTEDVTTVTTMTTAVGGYTGITAEDLSSEEDYKFKVYDNLGEFYILLESNNADANGDATRDLLYAGKPFESMESDSNLIGYSMVASAELTISTGELSSGLYSHLLDGDGVLATEANFVLNRSNNVAVFVGTPTAEGDGIYTLESMVGTLNQTTGTVYGYASTISNGASTGAYNFGDSLADAAIFGSANQGIGLTINNQEELISAVGVRTDTPAGVALTPATDTDGSTGTATWGGSLAGVRNAASGDPFEHGVIELLSFDKDTGVVDSGYLTLGSVSGGVVTSESEYLDIDPTSSGYASDDYMVMGIGAASYNSNNFYTYNGDGGGIMVTSPDGVEDDYASWGYWGAAYGDPTTTGFEFSPISTWVAGNVVNSTVMGALSSAQTSMSFSGHVLGYIATLNNETSQFENFLAIDTANSLVNLSVDFGVENPISGSITFSPTNDSTMVWDMDIDRTTSSINYTNGSYDIGGVDSGADSTLLIGNTELHGHFYGDGTTVTSMGGSFASGAVNLTTGVGYSANGVIKATRD